MHEMTKKKAVVRIEHIEPITHHSLYSHMHRLFI